MRRNVNGISNTYENVTIKSIIITFIIFIIFYLSNGFFQNTVFEQGAFKDFNFLTNPEKISQAKNEKQNNSQYVQSNNVFTVASINANAINTNKDETATEKKLNEWKIFIPSIGVDAPISEGTSVEVMNKFVGHFENTELWNGNVALAAHNRGYPVNYFANIKNLRIGEIIEYYYLGNTRKYKISTIAKIKDTDWSYLGKTEDNRITLITCVENEPEYRRCIQGVEIY